MAKGKGEREGQHHRDGSSRWCLIESDPGVFTELVEKIGVKDIEFEEILGVDEESFRQLKHRNQKLYGFIFLFNWTKDSAHQGDSSEGGGPSHDKDTLEADVLMQDDSNGILEGPPDLFFAKQVIENACATQAILSVLLNKKDEISIGPTLTALADFTKDLPDPYMRGEAIGDSELIRSAHNSFRTTSPFDWADDDDEKEKEDAFHFISYLYFNGKAYEMDGLQTGPKCLGECGADDWMEVVRKQIQHRISKIQKAASGELRFNLMAVVEDNLSKLKEEIYRQRVLIQRANIKMISMGLDIELQDEVDEDNAPADIPTIEDLPDDVPEIKKLIEQAEEQKKILQEQEETENDKRRRWRKENVRRRHDFVPFLLCVLKHMARRGELVPAAMNAQSRARGGDQGRQHTQQHADSKKKIKTSSSTSDEKKTSSTNNGQNP